METGDSRAMALILKRYKTKDGNIDYPTIFTIPSEERLPALYEKDFMYATALVVGALTMAFERMRFKNMDGKLVNDIAEEILVSSDEDNLGLEDLVLFLQNMTRGKYGHIESMSVAKFMSLFDKYRDERHNAILDYRENEHLQFKGLGDANRTSKGDPLSEHFSKLGDTISSLKNSLKETKKENHVLKQMDKL